MAAEDHPIDSINLEAANSQSDIVQKTYGYLNLDKIGFADRKLNDIVLSISKENSSEKHPLAIYKIGYKTVEIVFGNHEARETAANDGLAIFSQKVIISRPRSLKKDKAVYLYGIPVQESAENIRRFLSDKLNLKVKSEIRWLAYPGTVIRNGGRSAMVEVDDGTFIPGCAYYESLTSKPLKVTLWYPNMPAFCRKCMMKGHLARDCPKNFRNVTETDFPLPKTVNYATALKSQKKNSTEKDTEVFPELEVLPKTYVQRRMPPAPSQQTENAEAEYYPFFTKNDMLSNFYECNFDINGINYQSTEQYLFSEKAKKVGDTEMMNKIMKNRAARICKEFGESIDWPGDLFSWREFAKDKLKIANMAKYSKNVNLRKFLFSTAPAILVEASPHDRYWGVGLKKNDANIQDVEKWQGENMMGYLLTDIRDELMLDPDMAIEKSKRSLGSPDDISQQRKRTSVSSA